MIILYTRNDNFTINVGNAKNTAIANSVEMTMVMAISLLDISSSSSPAALAEKDKAFMPITRDS